MVSSEPKPRNEPLALRELRELHEAKRDEAKRRSHESCVSRQSAARVRFPRDGERRDESREAGPLGETESGSEVCRLIFAV